MIDLIERKKYKKKTCCVNLFCVWCSGREKKCRGGLGMKKRNIVKKMA